VTTAAPGIYVNFPIDDYYRDPCPAPSLTQSLVKMLLDRSPLHAWHKHPRLNPDWKPADPTKFDLGNTAHALLLGRGKEIATLPYDDWRTKEARIAREEARQMGKLAVLLKTRKRAGEMVVAAREQLALRGLGGLLGHGDAEVMLMWNEGATWCRQLLDFLSTDRLTVVDYKTTELAAAPMAVPRMMVNAGWQIQAAMADRGLGVLDPERAGRRRYLFVVQEAEPPYCLNVAEIGEVALTMGAKMVQRAVDLWAECLATDRFPGYPAEILQPEFPTWAEWQWLDREVREDELARRKDEGEPLGGYPRAAFNILAGG